MKKTLLFFIFLFSVSILQVSAQNVLALADTKTGETTTFRKGSYIVFGIKADKSVHEGFIRDITDSSLVFDNAQVALSQIDVLAGNTRERIHAQKTAETIGTILLVGGITALCVVASASSYHYHPHYHHSEFHPQIWLNLGYIINWNTCPIDRSIHLRDYSRCTAKIVSEDQNASEKISPSSDEKPKKEKSKNDFEDDVYQK